MRLKNAVPIAALAAMTAGMALTAEPPEAGPEVRSAFVAFALLAATAWAFALRQRPPSLWRVLLVAFALRLLVLPLPPTVSDDGYRYLWDGALVLDGQSPYMLTPREMEAAGFDAPVPLASLNSPDYHSVYPPVSQLGFAAAMWLGRGDPAVSWWVWKALLLFVEMAGLWALARLVSVWAVAFVGWHPVAILETAGQGHTEGLALGLILLGLLSISRQRPWRGGTWLALAGGVKLWPFALAPVAGRWRVLGVAAVLGFALLWPLAGGRAGESLELYAGTFDFYSLPYVALKSGLWPVLGDGSSRVASGVLGVLIVAVVSVIAIISWVRDPGEKQREEGVLRAIGVSMLTVTLLSPTLHPWHLLPALVAAALLQSRSTVRAVSWLVSFAPVTYLVYVGMEWAYTAAIVVGWGGAALIFVAPSHTRAVSALLRRRGRSKWNRLRSHVPPRSRVLDYGCAEGFVGAAAHEDGYDVLLSDLNDARDVDLPFVSATDAGLPLADRSVDVAVLVFVLHHASSPEAVLEEALRVSEGTALVWETVPAPWMPRRVLEAIDRLANRQRPGEEAMPPARLRSVAEWEAGFVASGYRVERLARWGVLHPQILWRISTS